MPLPLIVAVLGFSAWAAHRTGVLHRVAARVSVVTAAYANTNPDVATVQNNNNTQQQFFNKPYIIHEGGFSNPMVRKEALLMLGFPENQLTGPEPKEVQKQYRFLMTKFHTDVGGSDVICQKLNQAKDTLLPPK
jgi:hypothetical protein